MKNALRIASAMFALVSASFATVTISSPTAGTAVGSPVHVVASATSSTTITTTKIYVDNNGVYSVSGGNVDTMVTMSTGTHSMVVQAWDKAGVVQKASSTVTVGTTSSGDTSGGTMTIPSTAKVFSNIDEMTGWQSCSSCAGAGGTGATIPYSMVQGQSTPSMDGKSVKFSIGGTSPYGAALWWKQLGAISTAKNFVYDGYFYIKDPTAAQSLEFDANQSVGGHKYIMGTQCNIKGGRWDVYDAYNHTWVSSGVPCSVPTAYTWHHFILEFQRTSGGQTKFVSITLDGKKNYVNHSYNPRSSSVNELNVAFQMDGDKYMTDYSVWLDKLKFSVW